MNLETRRFLFECIKKYTISVWMNQKLGDLFLNESEVEVEVELALLYDFVEYDIWRWISML